MPKPFKGNSFYEWQIGKIVFQIRHKGCTGNFPRFNIWKVKG